MAGDTKKPRSPFVVPRPLEPPFPGGPGSSIDAPLEPQGPCLPAGPPELLLRLGREEAAVHIGNVPHNRWFMQPFSAAGPGEPRRFPSSCGLPATGGTYRPCPHGAHDVPCIAIPGVGHLSGDGLRRACAGRDRNRATD